MEQQLVFIENNQVVTDSLMVAKVFDKDHDKVMRDIGVQIKKLLEAGEEQFSTANFGESTYRNDRGREYKKYILTEDAFTLVTMSYTTVETMKFKVKYIQQFNAMREQLKQLSQPSYMIPDPIARAERWIEEYKQFQQVEAEKKLLQNELQVVAPKAAYTDDVLQANNAMTITQIAKDYGMTGNALNKILHEEKVQYKSGKQWLLYKEHENKGYTKSHTVPIGLADGDTIATVYTRWTQKGRHFINEILNKRGIYTKKEA